MSFLKDFTFVYVPHPQNKTDSLKQAFEERNVKTITPDEYKKGNVILYGKMRGLYHVYLKCKENGYNFLYIDNGYLKKDKEGNVYYRIFLNSEDIKKFDSYPEDRLEKFEISFKDWSDEGEIILLIPPSPFRQLYEGANVPLWIHDVRDRLKNITEKDTYVKEKFDGKNLKELIKNSYAVVCHSSTVGLDALKEGKRVVCENQNYFLYNFSHKDLNLINQPMEVDRNYLFRNLSYNQFTLSEIADGTMEKINEKYGIFNLI